MYLRRRAAALLLALSVSACGGIIDPSKNTKDTFNGTLALGGTNVHPYSLARSGEVEVTITSLVPSVTNGSIGVAMGQMVSGTCSPLAGYIAAGTLNRTVQFGVLNRGDVCVIVFDPSILTTPVAYVGTFSHP